MNQTSQAPSLDVDPANASKSMPLASQQLFGDKKEIVIVHNCETYRLRITRNNKLILTK